jgi:quinoprotein glucose dehydrogenase
MMMDGRIPAAIALAACVAVAPQRSVSQRDGDWPSSGGDPGAQRYSPLTQITPGNVATLEQAWSFDPEPRTCKSHRLSSTA